jgi:hypothetical protein
MNMKSVIGYFSVLLAATALAARASEKVNVAEDDATQSGIYGGGWNNNTDGGIGFGPWVLRTAGNEEAQTHAGFFVADTENHPDLNAIALENKAFGMFANGVGYETACAFRSLDRPMQVGDSFSVVMEHGRIERKFDADSEKPGSLGFVLRTGSKADACGDESEGARVEFGVFEGQETYQVMDGEGDRDTGVATSDAGVAVTVTLKSADTYDIEITTMGDNATKTLSDRKLAGAQGASIESLAIFNRDGEKNDFYFNSLRISRDAGAEQR